MTSANSKRGVIPFSGNSKTGVSHQVTGRGGVAGWHGVWTVWAKNRSLVWLTVFTGRHGRVRSVGRGSVAGPWLVSWHPQIVLGHPGAFQVFGGSSFGGSTAGDGNASPPGSITGCTGSALTVGTVGTAGAA